MHVGSLCEMGEGVGIDRWTLPHRADSTATIIKRNWALASQ